MAQFGVTPPICLRGPSDEDLELTKQLEEELRTLNYFETEEELQKRLVVLRRVDNLVKKWVKTVLASKNLPKEQIENAGGKLFTFGSYRWGVHTRGADIDSLCVVPRQVGRNDFFTSFFQMLKDENSVTHLYSVESAFVPVIKLQYNGIQLDILFAQLNFDSIEEKQMLDDDILLKNLDEKCIRSLNGCRVADEILKSIPDRTTFVVALRAIKLWAKNHFIYSNSLGFFGGVTWAIIVARICQLYPNACPSLIVEKLFLVFSTWDWPHPVFLKITDKTNAPNIQKLNELLWDPWTRITDRYHLMPVITPAYPEQNSTFNVTRSTRHIIMNEIRDALHIVLDINSGKKTWSNLFEPVNFFSRYRHFICLLCTTENQEDQASCGSLVEAKLRNLVVLLERNPAISICHVNPKQYRPVFQKREFFLKNSKEPITTLYFIGIEPSKNARRSIDLTIEIQQYMEMLTSSPSNPLKSTMNVRTVYCKTKDLPNYLSNDDIYGSKKNSLFMDEPHCDENGLPINKNDRALTPGNKIVFCNKHAIHLENVQVKQLERPNHRPAIHSFIPLHALFKGQKPSYGQSTPFECGCPEGSYYCIAFNDFMKKMRLENPNSPEFSTMTKSYLSSLAMCRTAIDADELDRADAEKTQDITYIPVTKAPLNLESVMQWFERLHTGPHPSVYAYDQTPFNLYDDGINFYADLSTNQSQHQQQQHFHQEHVLSANLYNIGSSISDTKINIKQHYVYDGHRYSNENTTNNYGKYYQKKNHGNRNFKRHATTPFMTASWNGQYNQQSTVDVGNKIETSPNHVEMNYGQSIYHQYENSGGYHYDVSLEGESYENYDKNHVPNLHRLYGQNYVESGNQIFEPYIFPTNENEKQNEMKENLHTSPALSSKTDPGRLIFSNNSFETSTPLPSECESENLSIGESSIIIPGKIVNGKDMELSSNGCSNENASMTTESIDLLQNDEGEWKIVKKKRKKELKVSVNNLKGCKGQVLSEAMSDLTLHVKSDGDELNPTFRLSYASVVARISTTLNGTV